MNLSERENAIGTWLRETVLPRYNRPDHLGEAAARAELHDMVTDINRTIPIMADGDFQPFLADAFSQLRRTYTGRSWPSIGVFCKAIEAMRKADPRPAQKVEYVPDDYRIVGDLIREEKPIGEDFIYGPKALELVHRGHASEADLDSYRRGMRAKDTLVYGEDVARRKEAERRAFHAASSRPLTFAEREAVKRRDREDRIKRMPKIDGDMELGA